MEKDITMKKARALYAALPDRHHVGFREWARSYFCHSQGLSPKLAQIVGGAK